MKFIMDAIKRCCLGILFCCLVGHVGCGSGGPETATVSGKVTLDGQPVPKGTISFVPQRGKSVRASIGEDGTFELEDGATIGYYQVAIISREGGEEEDTTPIYLVPRHYGLPGSSGLTFDVQSGEDNFAPFELTSKRPSRKRSR